MMRLISMRSSKGGLRCLKAMMTLQRSHLVAMQMQPQQYHTQTISEAAATTGAQKRALQHNQISPSTKVPPEAAEGGAAAASPPTDNSNTMMIGAAVAAGAVGAGYYYYTTTTKKDDVIPTTESPKEVATVKVEESKPVIANNNVSAPTTPVTVDTENRVTSIIVPSKMKNTSSATNTGNVIEVEDHPPQGNRVTNVFSPPPTVITDPTSEPAPVVRSDANDQKSSSDSNTKSTHEAIQELQNHTTASAMETLISSHQSMWSSNDSHIVGVGSDNATSNNNSATVIAQLQQRIGQLQYELQDRTKWEAIRLKEFLIMKEKEVTDQLRSIKYTH